MVKICHMTSAHKSNDVRIFEKECTSLAKNPDYEVWLVAQGDSRIENNVHVKGLGAIPRGRVKRIFIFAKDVYKESKKIDADVYHFHDPELIPFGLRLKLQGKKVIFDSHENYTYQIKTKEYIPAAVRGIISGAYGILETFAAKRFDAVIFPCRMEGKHPFEGRSRRNVFINNTPIFEETGFERKADKNGEFKACYVGILAEARGISKSVLAAAEAGVKLVLAGSFGSSDYEKRVRELPEFSCVDYRGHCTHDEVYNILEECTVGLSVLQDSGQYLVIETLPTKVYEYMQMKMPVILGSSPYTQKLNDEYRFAIMVDPSDEHEIARAITYLKDNPDICAEMGNRGYDLVKDRLNWAVEEKELFKLYQEVIES